MFFHPLFLLTYLMAFIVSINSKSIENINQFNRIDLTNIKAFLLMFAIRILISAQVFEIISSRDDRMD